MLGRIDRESPALATAAATHAGWLTDDTEPLELGDLQRALHTASWVGGMSLVARIGSPLHPAKQLEESLLAAGAGLSVRAVQSVDTRWVLATQGHPTRRVIVDEVAYENCGQAIEAAGLRPQIVPDTTENRLRLASDGSYVVLDATEVPPDWRVADGHPDPDWNSRVWFGLISDGPAPQPTGPAAIWMAFGPKEDRTGTLRDALGLFSERQISLTHLRSVAVSGTQHAFFVAFPGLADGMLSDLRAALDDAEIAHRTLAAFPYDGEPAMTATVTPVWGPR